MFDGILDTADLITLDIMMKTLSKKDRDEFIKEEKEENPEAWEQYLKHRDCMGYPEL